MVLYLKKKGISNKKSSIGIPLYGGEKLWYVEK